MLGFAGLKGDYKSQIENGAKVIDVRTAAEFREGHFENSLNLPVDEIDSWKSQFSDKDELILVCRSGARANYAKEILESIGIKASNAGAWQNLI